MFPLYPVRQRLWPEGARDDRRRRKAPRLHLDAVGIERADRDQVAAAVVDPRRL
jgi:hypothetical protein